VDASVSSLYERVQSECDDPHTHWKDQHARPHNDIFQTRDGLDLSFQDHLFRVHVSKLQLVAHRFLAAEDQTACHQKSSIWTALHKGEWSVVVVVVAVAVVVKHGVIDGKIRPSIGHQMLLIRVDCIG
jgi:hypothetical protein